jgi:predicted Zn-dependent protease
MRIVPPSDFSTRSRPGRSIKRSLVAPRLGALRPFDVLLILALGGIGAWVALQVVTRKSGIAAPPPQVAVPSVSPAGAQAAAPAASADTSHPDLPTEGDIAVATVQSAAPAPTRNLEEILARIAETPGTYMNDMIADMDGHLVRWPDKRQDGLRIWVQSMTSIANWDQRYAQMARDAFDDWGRDSELPIRFDFILDSATSDIRIVWADRFPPAQGQRVGVTRRMSDQYGWLVSADLQVAIHDSAGRTIPPAALAGIVRHEAGHALGLGHSNDQRTKMFPTETRSDISPADRSTLRLLYQLPPGLARQEQQAPRKR